MIKKFVCIAVAAALFNFILFPSPRAYASAVSYVQEEPDILAALSAGEDVYARIFSEGTYLFADGNLSEGIFIIPTTYFVKVRSYTHTACAVTYCYEDYDYARAVYGYVSTAALTFVSQPPTGKSFPNAFPEFEGNGTFYKNTRFDTFYSVNQTSSADAFFYGYYMRGNEQFCYVMYGGRFGYFSADVSGK